MGRSPCCVKEGLNRGAWTAVEDKILTEYIKVHGEGRWRNLPKRAGLKRCGKSCRLRWLNYLRPDIKRGNIAPDEEELIIRLHKLLGNRWSLIAGRLPGRTDNEIKNYWNTILSKKLKQKDANDADSKNSVIRTKATKCSKVVCLDPHSQTDHPATASSGPRTDAVVGESLPSQPPPPDNENLGFMSESQTQEACNLSELLNSGFPGLLPSSSSSSVRQDPLILDELTLMEDWNVQPLPFSSVFGDWLLE